MQLKYSNANVLGTQYIRRTPNECNSYIHL